MQETINPRGRPFKLFGRPAERFFLLCDLGEIHFLLFLQSSDIGKFLLCRVLIRQHSCASFRPLPLRLLHPPDIGAERPHQLKVFLRNRREILQSSLKVTIGVRRQQGLHIAGPALHILHTEPSQNGISTLLDAATYRPELLSDRVDFTILLPELLVNLLMFLTGPHQSFIKCLNPLKHRLPFFLRFIRPLAFLFDLIF